MSLSVDKLDVYVDVVRELNGIEDLKIPHVSIEILKKEYFGRMFSISFEEEQNRFRDILCFLEENMWFTGISKDADVLINKLKFLTFTEDELNQKVETLWGKIQGAQVGTKILQLCGSNISDEELRFALAKTPNLETFWLYNCPNLTEAVLPTLKNLQNLKTFIFGSLHLNLQGFDGKLLRSLAEFESLESIKFYDADDFSIKILSASNPPVKKLTLIRGTITNESLKDLGAMTYLTDLDIRLCDQITSEGLKHLNSLDNLKSLALSLCYNIVHVDNLNLQSIKFLKVEAYNDKISSQSVINFLTRHPSLEKIYIIGSYPSRVITGEFTRERAISQWKFYEKCKAEKDENSCIVS